MIKIIVISLCIILAGCSISGTYKKCLYTNIDGKQYKSCYDKVGVNLNDYYVL